MADKGSTGVQALEAQKNVEFLTGRGRRGRHKFPTKPDSGLLLLWQYEKLHASWKHANDMLQPVRVVDFVRNFIV
jgi:hypothetical protein